MRGWKDCPRCAGTGSGEGFRLCGLRPLQPGDDRLEAPVGESLPEAAKIWRVLEIRKLAEECCPDPELFLIGIAIGPWVRAQMTDEQILGEMREMLGECRKYIAAEAAPAKEGSS